MWHLTLGCDAVAVTSDDITLQPFAQLAWSLEGADVELLVVTQASMK